MYRIIPRDFVIADIERFCELTVRRGSTLISLKKHGSDDLRVVTGAWLLGMKGQASKDAWLDEARTFLSSVAGDWLNTEPEALFDAALDIGLLSEKEGSFFNELTPRLGVSRERLIDEIEMAQTILKERRARARENLQARNRAVNSGAPKTDTVEDEKWMRAALEEARNAAEAGEVPVGAVLVSEKRIVARAGNRTLRDADPTAHAEMLVLREGAKVLGNHRLNGTALYVTLEPCPMCAGAIVQARPERLVFGASDLKMGATGGAFSLFDIPGINHKPWVTRGVLKNEAANLLKTFFEKKRLSDEAGRT